jgi:hypothetical protein
MKAELSVPTEDGDKSIAVSMNVTKNVSALSVLMHWLIGQQDLT